MLKINRLYNTALLTAFLLAIFYLNQAQAAVVCGVPGTEGSGTVSGVVNDYWPGTNSPAGGSTSISLGSRRSGGAGNSITPGDLVLIIQIQDADINSTQSTNYGGNDGSGSGATALNNTGRYEYVRATNTVGVSGTLTFTPALTNSYRTRTSSGSNGQSRWQAIRVPQYSSATAANVTAPAWDGETGGVVVMDIESDLTLSGATAINVDGLGFRGGAGRTLTGAAGLSVNDFRTSAATATNASKGEGIAGTPRYINATSAYNADPNVTEPYPGTEGYPNGSYARGAPGNAGGGGTDGNPNANDRNSGGGGGSNYGSGGRGGRGWASTIESGGRGGAAFSGSLSTSRVFFGGGGGAGTTNNGTGDLTPYSAPIGLRCSAGNGACSSGASGGGIILIRAGSISGGGKLSARGSDAYNVANDGSGGGGGGGAVVLQASSGGNTTADVSGGNGGNAWRSQNTDGERHGPGGGGGGGYITYSGLNVFATSVSGLSGLTSNDDQYGASNGSGGNSTSASPVVPGVQPGAFCPVAIKAVELSIDSDASGTVDTGDTIEYTLIYRNGSSNPITGFNITDALPAQVSFVSGSINLTLAGGASGNVNNSYDGTTDSSLLASNVTLPTGGIITATLQATVATATATDVFNQADSVQSSSDVLGLTDNADNSQNGAGLPSGSYINQSPYGTSGATDLTGFTTNSLSSNLSTSTKIVIDLNGGEVEHNDTLRYTITMTNSGNLDATNVTVTDDIPANVSDFTVISTPSSSIDISTPGDGANGNGYLDIYNISVAANGSETITFEVTVSGSGGNTIKNEATVINPLGPGATPKARTLLIAGAARGNKRLYLYDDTSSPTYKLSRVSPTGLTGYATISAKGNSQRWALDPALAGNITTISGKNIPVTLWLSTPTTRTWNRDIEVRLACSSAPGTFATSGSQTRTIPGRKQPEAFTFNLSGNLPLTCTTGNSWELTVINRTNSGKFRVYAMVGADNSYVDLPSQNVINVDSIEFYDNSGAPVTTVSAGETIYIRSVVSDPFGSFDITGAELTLFDAAGNPVASVSPAAMTEVNNSGAATKTYESDGYLIPAFQEGNWTAQVESFEGTEEEISDVSQATFQVVSAPLLTILKSADSPTASPGQEITYTVTITNSNTGGPALNVVVDDDLSPYLQWGVNSFQFTADTSGLALGTLKYSNDGGTSYGYAPLSGGGGAPPGYDGDVTNWRITTTGAMVTDGEFQLEYKVKVE